MNSYFLQSGLLSIPEPALVILLSMKEHCSSTSQISPSSCTPIENVISQQGVLFSNQ
ncbi:hypothetical protein BTN49_1521 [Candidatus Enterovibrio escicola]|uniref:Uncharacterized protein n=1 Tax=Candidatus Enterovibrio escicola TaxID=1927127 RepID=A0A2A5T478_9GAMM|nr:hypothetical protein BTN49_1521 [Candidatus Enterovibrio escacola]